MTSVSDIDLRTLAGIDCEPSSSFVLAADGSGAIFFIKERRSFAFVNFETGEKTDLILAKKFQMINDIADFHAIFSFDEQTTDSHAEITRFVGLVQQLESTKMFCVWLSANVYNKSITVIDELDTDFDSLDIFDSYISKSKSGEVFYLMFNHAFNLQSVSQIFLNELEKLEIKEAIQHEQLLNINHESCPFICDGAVCYFPNGHYDTLTKLSFDGTQSSTTPLTADSEPPSYLIPFQQPVNHNGNILFCSSSNYGKKMTIWSLNMQQLCWSQGTIVRHHSPGRQLKANILNLVTNGTFLFIPCRNCENRVHVFPVDVEIGNAAVVCDKILGEGGFGTVMQGKMNDHGKIAIKIMHDFPGKSVDTKRMILLSAMSEARKLKILNHPNIIKGYGFLLETTRLLLFMELMRESVREKILKLPENRLQEKEAFQILQQTLEGLAYLHKFEPKPIVHRDIKCANILLDRNGKAKLGDFGLMKAVNLNAANSTDSALNETVGTRYWQAPEVIIEAKYGRKADVWSIGCSLVEMLTGDPPYSELTHTDSLIKLYSGKLSYNVQELIPLSCASNDIASILEKCFRRLTKKQDLDQNCSSQLIRPHSWELLADIISINEVQTASLNLNQLNLPNS